jgi:hypothetical protein
MRKVNFICVNAPNRQFVALLEEADSEYGESIYSTNIMWL